jgi:hypothetical protein
MEAAFGGKEHKKIYETAFKYKPTELCAFKYKTLGAQWPSAWI